MSAITPDIEQKAEDLRYKIESAENTQPAGEVFYLSADGDDSNNGRSLRTPWKSLNALKTHRFKPASTVLFRRGDIWRGSFEAQPGVTYGAYGIGKKPCLCGSPFDGAKSGTWTEVCPDIWRFSERIPDDCGGIVFDGGTCAARKYVLNYEGPVPVENVTKEPFRGYFDLTGDLSFWHDLEPGAVHSDDRGTIYLRSEHGNPAERFREIEFLPRRHGISVSCDNVTIDNLSVMYCGAHGIGAGTVNGLCVKNSVFGWIGGSLQYVKDGRPVRFGNGVEIYGGCRNYTVENCHVYQCYDAGITFQFSSGGQQDILMDGIRFSGNLIEKCSYSVEYFLGAPETPAADRQMRDILISGCIMRQAGYGWGIQRPDRQTPAHIKAWDHFNRRTGPFLIENNIMDQSRYMILHIGVSDEAWLPDFRGNTIRQYRGASFGRIGQHPTAMLEYNDRLAEDDRFRKDTLLFLE